MSDKGNEESDYSRTVILDFSCYQSNTSPIPPKLSSERILEVVKKENRVPFGAEKKWKGWSDDYFSFMKEHQEEISRSFVIICGFAPQPWFFFIGMTFGRTKAIKSFINFSPIANKYQAWEDMTNQGKPIFKIQSDLLNDKCKENFIQLHFSGSKHQTYQKVNDDVTRVHSFIPVDQEISSHHFGKIRREFYEELRSLNEDYKSTDRYAITSSLPNPLNFALGCVWAENVFGKPAFYDFVNREYKKVEGLPGLY